MLKKGFARVAVVALLAATMVVAPVSKDAQAQSAQGATAFSISFPSVVVLHYWSALNMTLSTAELTDFLIGNTTGNDDRGTKGAVTISDNAGTFEADAAITSSVTDPAAVTLHVQNAWAVRAVGTAALPNVTMSFTASSTTLTGPGANSIGASNYFVGTGGGVPSTSTVSFAAPGLSTPEVGDISLDLNLTGAGQSGTYSGSWTLQAEIT